MFTLITPRCVRSLPVRGCWRHVPPFAMRSNRIDKCCGACQLVSACRTEHSPTTSNLCADMHCSASRVSARTFIEPLAKSRVRSGRKSENYAAIDRHKQRGLPTSGARRAGHLQHDADRHDAKRTDTVACANSRHAGSGRFLPRCHADGIDAVDGAACGAP